MRKKVFYLISGFLLVEISALSQVRGWQHKDLRLDGVFGISTEKAYTKLLKGKASKRVVVAVIDYGIDTTHEDIKPIIWTNPNEIPGNGRDDDKNGLIDDIYGWNFIGSDSGKEDIACMAGENGYFYDSLSYSTVPDKFRQGYRLNRASVAVLKAHLNGARTKLLNLQEIQSRIDKIVRSIGHEPLLVDDFRHYIPKDSFEKKICDNIIKFLPYYKDFHQYKSKEIDTVLRLVQYHIEHALNINERAKSNVGSFEYGDNDVMGPFTLLPYPGPYHGTHVAGIIGSKGGMVNGVPGVADNVSIMSLRVLSFFRELRDETLARAIRYAVDNGAKIINLSLGKSYTWDKKCVDEAVKYAMKSDVLIVHAAGNDGIDLDSTIVYPNRIYADGGQAEAWLEVAASGPNDDLSLVAPFSNYGGNSVDVFAPGESIYSTVPGSAYEYQDGTSMAAPMVTGIAALIREYYPELTAVQVKNIIMKSVVRVDHEVNVNGDSQKRRLFSKLCISGGVVNAYEAIRLAGLYK